MMNFQTYFRDLEKELRTGNATEHTHRPALKTLLESIGPEITATNEPKRIACGAPDFIVTQRSVPLGYVEAKDVGKSLNETLKTDQLRRYLDSLDNLILTDYLEFRWFLRGEHRKTVRLADESGDGKLRGRRGAKEDLTELLQAFLHAQAPTVKTSRELAERMAALARLIRESIDKAFAREGAHGMLHSQLEGFREVLLHTLTAEQFADMYAQTICYGLFAACVNKPDDGQRFTREHAAYDLPRTNPFLQRLFTQIAGPGLDDSIAWAVDDLAELLNRTDIPAILRDFGKRTRQEDPIVHFYETFLAAYDPKMREARGVYYTPEPVVSYIVRSVDHLLKEEFGLKDGLADASKTTIKMQPPNRKTPQDVAVHRVQILDPATGTGTFLFSVIDLIRERFAGNEGMWNGYVSRHLLPRLYGFEFLMAPYTIAHMKLDLQLEQSGYDFASDERLQVYLTNTLEEAHEYTGLPLFTQWLADEANAAAKVKTEAPVMVVLGNPPYSGHSANKSPWIHDLMRGKDRLNDRSTENYFEMDGKPLGERNPKWLNDDYVKFIRFAQWRIEQTGYGILAFITNHGYLDNPTFRGMRESLMNGFDDIYLLDLHGNSKKKETTPDGSPDENVFDIQQGVAIGIFVRKSNNRKPGVRVYHTELWGKRDEKYDWLWKHDAKETPWEEIEPKPELLLFVPYKTDLLEEYESGWKVTEVFPLNAVGMNSHRDSFAISFDVSIAERRVNDLTSDELLDDELRLRYSLKDTNDFNLVEARNRIGTLLDPLQIIEPCLYRPFDFRYVLYHTSILDRPRSELNYHIIQRDNLAIATTRQTREPFAALAMERVCGQHKIVAKYDGSYIFPLYLYPDPEKKDLFEEQEARDTPGGRRPNLAPVFIEDASRKLGLNFIENGKGNLGFPDEQGKVTMKLWVRVADPSITIQNSKIQGTFGPEDVFHYAYAVFHSPAYRTRYAEFLKIDFPRLPLTSNLALFQSLCEKGEALVGLHLLETVGHGSFETRYPVPGDNEIARGYPTYKAPGQPAPGAQAPSIPEGRVYINPKQYFDNVAPEAWTFYVGGYQVLDKWLKDRRGRRLTYDDLTHYQQIVVALRETVRLMEEIDDVIEKHAGWPLS